MQTETNKKSIVIIAFIVLLGVFIGLAVYLMNYSNVNAPDVIPTSSPSSTPVPSSSPTSEVKSAVLNEDFLITLPANPSTGYSWEARFDEDYLMLRSKDFVQDKSSKPDVVGAGGTEIFTFAPIKSGNTAITMLYKRSWEEEVLEKKEFSYRIVEKKINKSEVVVSTDKEEYEQGETVKITVRNGLNKSIWGFARCGLNPSWNLQKFDGSEWKELNFSLPRQEKEKEICDFVLCERPELTELKPGLEINYDWHITTICEWPLSPIGMPTTEPKNIEEGIYRVVISYGFGEDFSSSEGKTIYSNEFTIKGKSVIDLKCNQKAKVSGPCSKVGYEFDSSKEKCVVVNGAGCIDNLPFSTMEECQKVCETSVTSEGEMRFETIDKKEFSSYKERKNFVIRNINEWKSLLSKIDYSVKIPPEIDFDKEMIIVAFQGEFPTGGYDIEITKIVENKNNIEVFVKEVSPGRSCMVTMAFTAPYHIVKVQKSDKEIMFNVKSEVNNCPEVSQSQDVCDIGKGSWGDGNIIFTENNISFDIAKQNCEVKSECSWKDLGGKVTDHFACCPKDLNNIIIDDNRKLYKRCYVRID